MCNVYDDGTGGTTVRPPVKQLREPIDRIGIDSDRTYGGDRDVGAPLLLTINLRRVLAH